MPDDNTGKTGSEDANAKGGDGKGAENQNINNKGGDQTGADPDKKTDAGKPETQDVTLSDEQFEKLFDDPRLYKHPRFKNLTDRAKKADEFEVKEQKAKEDKLLEDKKYTELIAEKDKTITGLQEQLKGNSLSQAIMAEAQKQGAVDLESVTKLVDRSAITVGEDGTVTGVEDAVKGLLEAKPFLKSGNNTNIGSGTAPNNQQTSTTGKKFKLSQLQDAEFYRTNEKEIMEAQKNGLIENDMPM